MWTSIQLKNFKGYRDSGNVPFRKLTVLIGANGSGKSTLIQSLLLCKQTAVSIDQSSALITDGEFVSIGSYKNFVHFGNGKKNIEISLNWMEKVMYGSLLILNNTEPVEINKAGDQIQSGIRVLLGLNQEKSIIVKELSYFDHNNKPIIDVHLSSSKNVELGKASIIKIFENIKNDPLYEPFSKLLNQPGKEKPLSFPMILDAFASRNKFYRISDSGIVVWQGYILEVIKRGYEQKFEEQLLKTTYIGPLRERPDRYYFVPHEQTSSIDPSGKKTGAALFGEKGVSLIEKSSRWMKALDIAEEIRLVKVKGDDIFSLQITGKGQKYSSNIADFGFGASQILPIIVESLLSDDDACVLIEQPEIHLNAHHQVLLPNFFAEIINTSQKQFIIETHSEYFLKRLGTLVAKKVLKPEDVIILYAYADTDGSHIKPITLDELGRFSDWPEGFLEEGFEASAEHMEALESFSEGEENA